MCHINLLSHGPIISDEVVAELDDSERARNRALYKAARRTHARDHLLFKRLDRGLCFLLPDPTPLPIIPSPVDGIMPPLPPLGSPITSIKFEIIMVCICTSQ